MKKELDDKLCQKYPDIFKERNGNMQHTAMCWGFACGDGWYELIDTLCGLISHDIKYNKMPEVTAIQVKEKYGSLRFYVDGGDNRTDAYISFAESMSYKTCEECGASGASPSTNGWIAVRCEDCAQE